MELATNVSVNTHVGDFLSFVNSGERFARLARLTSRAAERDAETQKDLASIREWLAQPRTKPANRKQETLDKLFPVLYLRAQEGIRAAKISAVKDVKRQARKAKGLLESLEENFTEKLLAEMERLKNDSLFSRKIELAKAEIDQITPELEEVAGELIPKLSSSGVSGKAAKDVITEASMRCTINGADAPCWLVVGIVVVAIALKV